MKKLAIPFLLFLLCGVVIALCSLAKQDLVYGFFRPRQTIDWNEDFPHYMRIRHFLPGNWRNYQVLYEQCFLSPNLETAGADGQALKQIKALIALSAIMGEMRQFLTARQFEAGLLMVLSLVWMLRILHREMSLPPKAAPASEPRSRLGQTPMSAEATPVKKWIRVAAGGFLVLGIGIFALTGLIPPDKWDASTQLWQNAKQSLPVRRALYEHWNFLQPMGGASLALAAVLGWIGRAQRGKDE